MSQEMYLTEIDRRLLQDIQYQLEALNITLEKNNTTRFYETDSAMIDLRKMTAISISVRTLYFYFAGDGDNEVSFAKTFKTVEECNAEYAKLKEEFLVIRKS